MDDLDTRLSDLLQAGQEPDQDLLDRIKALGPEVAPRLIAMATDEELNQADGEDPRVWAPLHAVRLLGEMGAAEALEPLLPLLDLDDDWMHQALPVAFGGMGAAALAPLRAYLFDRGKNMFARGRVARGLREVAERDPSLRGEVIEALVRRLDPEHSQTPEDETLNAFVIGELLDLKATEAHEAMARAFEEDRVDRMVVGPDELTGDIVLPSFDDGGFLRRREKGINLWLDCKACGYTRQHHVDQVYCHLPTTKKKERGEETPYSEFILTKRITCPKCGAVDQYAFGGQGLLQLTAEMIRLMALRKMGEDPEDEEVESPLVFTSFTLADGREMHPQEARDMYRQQVEEQPNRADLRVRYGNVLRFLGYRDDAAAQYRAAAQLDPQEMEAYLNLGTLAEEAGDKGEAWRMFHKVVALAPTSRLPHRQREEYVRYAQAALPSVAVAQPRDRRGGAAPAPAATLQPLRAAAKVGRNDPCPCGSGKKYKKCCGR